MQLALVTAEGACHLHTKRTQHKQRVARATPNWSSCDRQQPAVGGDVRLAVTSGATDAVVGPLCLPSLYCPIPSQYRPIPFQCSVCPSFADPLAWGIVPPPLCNSYAKVRN